MRQQVHSYLYDFLWGVAVNTEVSVGVGVWTAVEGGVDGGEVSGKRSRNEVASLQRPVGRVHCKALHVTDLSVLQQKHVSQSSVLTGTAETRYLSISARTASSKHKAYE